MKGTILITGASRGIGRELALQASLQYSNLILISRNFRSLQDIEKEIGSRCQVHCLPLDLAEMNFEGELTAYINSKGLEIDAVIHNAGLLINKPFEELGVLEVEKMYRVNVLCVYPLLQAVLPRLNSGGSHVIFISSMGGVGGSSKFPGLSGYSSSKAALGVLAECLAEEYGKKGHHFNILALGAVQTEMLSEAFPGYEAPVSAKEMGEFIMWFADNGGKYMNGKTIPVALSTP